MQAITTIGFDVDAGSQVVIRRQLDRSVDRGVWPPDIHILMQH